LAIEGIKVSQTSRLAPKQQGNNIFEFFIDIIAKEKLKTRKARDF